MKKLRKQSEILSKPFSIGKARESAIASYQTTPTPNVRQAKHFNRTPLTYFRSNFQNTLDEILLNNFI